VPFMYLIHGPRGGRGYLGWNRKHVHGAPIRPAHKETHNTTTRLQGDKPS
jgi:hypothetical protein